MSSSLLASTLLAVLQFGHATQAIKSPASDAQNLCMLDYAAITSKNVTQPLTEVLGHYVKELGQGSFGTAGLYRRFEDEKFVVVKTMHPPASDNEAQNKEALEDCAWLPFHVQQIKLEYYLGTLLSKLPICAETLDLLYNTYKCEWSVVLEYIPHSLTKLHQSLSAVELADILLYLEGGIEEMHAMGISHGDIKMENILLATDYRPVLIDMGSATFHTCSVEGEHTNSNVVPTDYGTPDYLPPEVFTVLEFDRTKADLWALGITALRLFKGYTPWPAANLEYESWRRFVGAETPGDRFCRPQLLPVISQPSCLVSMVDLLDGVPPSIVDIVASWLELDPDRRKYSSRS